MPVVDLALLGIIALVLGSFIGALTYRVPRGLGFITGRSFCDRCHKSLSWYDNLPVVSFVLLGGRSRCCGKKISVRYLMIELASLAGALVVYFLSHNYLVVFIYLLALAIFIIDLEHQIIPDGLVFFGLAVFMVIYLLSDNPLLFPNFLAGLVAADFLLGIHLITLGRGMGLGDVKLALLGGLILGLKLSVVWFFLAFLTGGILGAILVLMGRARLKQAVAFGPFLCVSLVIALIWGEKILSLYF